MRMNISNHHPNSTATKYKLFTRFSQCCTLSPEYQWSCDAPYLERDERYTLIFILFYFIIFSSVKNSQKRDFKTRLRIAPPQTHTLCANPHILLQTLSISTLDARIIFLSDLDVSFRYFRDLFRTIFYHTYILARKWVSRCSVYILCIQ